MAAGLGQAEQWIFVAIVDGGLHSDVAVIALASRIRGNAGISSGNGPRR